jgi:hypothetical protein
MPSFVRSAISRKVFQPFVQFSATSCQPSLTWEHIGFSGDWDRAAATASKRRPLNLGHMREYRLLFAKSSSLALFI